jgi:carbamoyl-phosphate synthase large subunit
LIAGDGNKATLAMIRALARAGNAVALATTKPGSHPTRSRYAAAVIEVPEATGDVHGYVAALIAAARNFRVDALLPAFEAALIALAGADKGLLPDVAVGAPDAALVASATDKGTLPWRAEQAGLRTPRTERVLRSELAGRADEYAYPLMLKVQRTREETGARVFAVRVETRDELRVAAAQLRSDDLLLQEVIDGKLLAVVGAAWDGRVVATVHQQAERIWPRGAGISALAVTTPRDPALDAGVERLISGLGWSGLFQLQLIRDDRGAHVIDLNPRPYGSLALAVASGVNLPQIWLDLLLGQKPKVGSYRVPVYYRSEDRDALALREAIRGRSLRDVLAILRPRRPTTHAVFSWRDPAPISVGLDKARRRIARGVGRG